MVAPAGFSLWILLLEIMVTPHRVRAQKTGDKGGIREYAPGLRIDWDRRVVEIDGRVVLRQGPLELFACSLGTREHESIVVTAPQPLRIHEAMGLIGLQPGHPITHDPDTDKWLPPTGQRLRIQVRTADAVGSEPADITSWMQSFRGDKTLPPQSWLFAGSLRTKDGAFTADLDGTVICVVDFPSALIALPELRSADNSQLWVRAKTEAIPPIGTRVTLLVSSAKPLDLDPTKSREHIEQP